MRRQVISIACIAVAILVAAPTIGWPVVVRLPAVLVPAGLLAILALRPWTWHQPQWDALERWQPTRREIALAAAAVFLLLFWIVLTRFQSGEINAVDFTVYFDRPCYQTTRRHRPLFVEVADQPSYSNRSQMTVHAFWAMLPICAPYSIYPTPYWLLIASVLVVIAGAVHIVRIGQTLMWGGVLAASTALAFVLNDNMARTLNGGFHAEVLYAWFIPWALDAGLRRERISYLAATFACALVKEDAFLVLFAVAVCLVLVRNAPMTRSDRVTYLLLPTAVALLNLVLFYRLVVPALTPDGQVTYAAYWSNYGPTPARAMLAMVSHPGRVLNDATTSGFLPTVMAPHLLLPVIGWEWFAGAVPIVVLYGSSANPQLRAFGIYYATVLVPFLALGASSGAVILARRFKLPRPTIWAGAVVVLGALIVSGSSGGYSLRRWRREVAAVPDAVAALNSAPVVLVQSGLYAHAGYSESVQLLTPQSLLDPRNRNAALLIAPEIGGYPFGDEEIRSLARLPLMRPMPGGLLGLIPNP